MFNDRTIRETFITIGILWEANIKVEIGKIKKKKKKACFCILPDFFQT